MPSADFARATSAESAENSGLRAGSDCSISPISVLIDFLAGFACYLNFNTEFGSFASDF